MPAAAPRQTIEEPVSATIALLREWLARTLSVETAIWLDTEIDRQRDTVDERRLEIAIGHAGRKIGHAPLALTERDLTAAQALHAYWQPDLWTTDEAARVGLLLATWIGDEDAFAARIDRLCATAELSEHVAFLKGFAVFPAGRPLLRRARESVRSSVQAAFEAIALHSRYPADHFDEAAFNQMVVKCVFSGLPIGAIVDLDARRNDDLVRMLRDLVSERHAAGRAVSDEVLTWISPQLRN